MILLVTDNPFADSNLTCYNIVGIISRSTKEVFASIRETNGENCLHDHGKGQEPKNNRTSPNIVQNVAGSQHEFK